MLLLHLIDVYGRGLDVFPGLCGQPKLTDFTLSNRSDGRADWHNFTHPHRVMYSQYKDLPSILVLLRSARSKRLS